MTRKQKYINVLWFMFGFFTAGIAITVGNPECKEIGVGDVHYLIVFTAMSIGFLTLIYIAKE